MELTAKAVHEIMSDCLYTDNEVSGGDPPDDAIIVEGVVNNYGFHPDRLETHKAEIAELPVELPDNFQAETGAVAGVFLMLV